MRFGRIDGLKEAALKTAKAMKAKGFGVNDIAEITGLSLQEIALL